MRRSTRGRGGLLLAALSAAGAGGALWLSAMAERPQRAVLAREARLDPPPAARAAEPVLLPGADEAADAVAGVGAGVGVGAEPPARSPEAPPAGERAPLAAEAPAGAVVAVELTDALGHAVHPARLELRSTTAPGQAAAAAPGGSVRFAVEPGEHVVLAHDLPEGWLGPWGQERNALSADDPAARPGFLARRVRVGPGEAVAVRLRAFRPARARGRVLGLDGTPAEGVRVRLRSQEPDGPIADARTDALGGFALADLYPGAYELQLGTRQAARPEERRMAPSAPVPLVIEEGAVLELGELFLRPGIEELRGRFVDQEGEPVAGLGLELWRAASDDGAVGPPRSPRLASGATDAEGAFAFADLPAEPVRLTLAPLPAEACSWREHGLPLAFEPLAVDLAEEGSSLDLGSLRVRVSRPFHYLARVRIDEPLAGEHGPEELRVRLEPAGDPTALDGAPSELTLDPLRGEVSWWADTPHPPVVLVVSLGSEERARRLEPRPDETVEDVITFP